jgi:hypothetical protein
MSSPGNYNLVRHPNSRRSVYYDQPAGVGSVSSSVFPIRTQNEAKDKPRSFANDGFTVNSVYSYDDERRGGKVRIGLSLGPLIG